MTGPASQRVLRRTRTPEASASRNADSRPRLSVPLPVPAATRPSMPRVTNARTEGYNRKIKQIKRVACGFRNQSSYERRILLNNAATAA